MLCLLPLPCSHFFSGLRVQLLRLSFVLRHFQGIARSNELRRHTRAKRSFDLAEGNYLTRFDIGKLPLPALSVVAGHDMRTHVPARDITDHCTEGSILGRHINPD